MPHLLYDTRYTKLGMKVSELILQDFSGILAQLEELPLYSEYVPDPEDEKSQIYYDLYNRNTIGWPLECDKDLHRAEVIRKLKLI
jgi:hypothetical protein